MTYEECSKRLLEARDLARSVKHRYPTFGDETDLISALITLERQASVFAKLAKAEKVKKVRDV